MSVNSALAKIKMQRYKVSVDLMFLKGRNTNWWDTLVCWWTGGDYSRVAFCFNEELVVRFTRGRSYLAERQESPDVWDIFRLEMGAIRVKSLLHWCQKYESYRRHMFAPNCATMAARGLKHVEFQSLPDNVSANKLSRCKNNLWKKVE